MQFFRRGCFILGHPLLSVIVQVCLYYSSIKRNAFIIYCAFVFLKIMPTLSEKNLVGKNVWSAKVFVTSLDPVFFRLSFSVYVHYSGKGLFILVFSNVLQGYHCISYFLLEANPVIILHSP